MVYIADAQGRTDAAYDMLVRHIPSPLDIVMVSWVDGFVFNERLRELDGKDWLLIDYREFGWDFKIKESHIWGVNEDKSGRYSGGDWDRFNEWIKGNPPKLIFQRELHQRDVLQNVYPIDYPSTIPEQPLQREEQFLSRPISASYYFGRSHEGRLRLHSDIWRGATDYGYSVCDNLYYFDAFMKHEAGKKYVSLHIPHYCRHDISNLVYVNSFSKIGIVPWGAGVKTFRASEVPCNQVMLMWNDELKWSYSWINGVNCITCEPGKEVATIEYWTRPENGDRLYSIYLAGVETWKKYRVQDYIQNYILPKINQSIR